MAASASDRQPSYKCPILNSLQRQKPLVTESWISGNGYQWALHSLNQVLDIPRDICSAQRLPETECLAVGTVTADNMWCHGKSHGTVQRFWWRRANCLMIMFVLNTIQILNRVKSHSPRCVSVQPFLLSIYVKSEFHKEFTIWEFNLIVMGSVWYSAMSYNPVTQIAWRHLINRWNRKETGRFRGTVLYYYERQHRGPRVIAYHMFRGRAEWIELI